MQENNDDKNFHGISWTLTPSSWLEKFFEVSRVRVRVPRKSFGFRISRNWWINNFWRTRFQFVISKWRYIENISVLSLVLVYLCIAENILYGAKWGQFLNFWLLLSFIVKSWILHFLLVVLKFSFHCCLVITTSATSYIYLFFLLTLKMDIVTSLV